MNKLGRNAVMMHVKLESQCNQGQLKFYNGWSETDVQQEQSAIREIKKKNQEEESEYDVWELQ